MRNRKLILSLVTLAWLSAIGFGFHLIMAWDFTPGRAADGAPGVAKTPGKIALVMVIHTECPCSSAALENLRALSDDERRRMSIELVFTGPKAYQGSDATNVKLASKLPGCKLRFVSEREAQTEFHAYTSGQAFLYDAQSRLVYSGGLTSTRGSTGDCVGLQAIRQTLGGEPCAKHGPVFGCSLQTPGEKL